MAEQTIMSNWSLRNYQMYVATENE